MNAKIYAALAALLMVGFVAGTAYSEDAKPAAESHEHHLPGDQGGAMNGMDMGKMHEMMHECMSMHKDGKMCNHDMMEKCEKQMGKGECQKMMKEVTAKAKKK